MPERFVKTGPLELWTESFGDPNNPAILLIMGAGAQGIFWPDRFCQILADNGFFVIRYDNRDVGQSSSIDFSKNPYSLDEMADDAIAILNAYGIEKANIVGASMGSTIAQLLALNHPERVLSLVLFMSTPDLSVIVRSIIPYALRPFMGFYTKKTDLPSPSPEVIKFYRLLWLFSPKDQAAWLKMMHKAWLVFSAGSSVDEEEIKSLNEKAVSRARSLGGVVNHSQVIKASAKKKINLAAIDKPTLIIHGQNDPVFPPEHGKFLSTIIPNAHLEIIPDMGHVIPTALSEKLAALIVHHIKNFYSR